MKSSTPASPLPLIAIVISFALGFGFAWLIRAPEAVPAPLAATAAGVAAGRPAPAGFGDAWTAAAQPERPAVAALPVNAGVDELWARALQPGDRAEAGYAAEDSLRKLAQNDPAARRKLIGFYATAQTPQARALLQATLSTVPTPDVVFFANRLANGSSPADRAFGFAMLRSVAPNAPETRSLALRTLATEQSPEILLAALSTLESGTAGPEETAQVLAQLTSLSQHADPAVRSRSLQQLGQWDKGGEHGARLSQALGDSAPEVRQAAIFAIAQTGTRAPSAKESLLALAGNAQESRDLRGSALQVLERFPLSQDEYAQLVRARGQIQPTVQGAR